MTAPCNNCQGTGRTTLTGRPCPLCEGHGIDPNAGKAEAPDQLHRTQETLRQLAEQIDAALAYGDPMATVAYARHVLNDKARRLGDFLYEHHYYDR
ncbi:MAG: hypothetical protein HOV83_07205 [Catenulispora sp.]|nr:hypothetical protein [Catenulispora sp.]